VLKKDKYILVLGSKPNSIIPKEDISHIYAANGASELASQIIKNDPSVKLTSVVTGKEFTKNLEVQRRVISANPDRLISRITSIDIQNYNFSKKVEYLFLKNIEQLKLQSNFFKFGMLNIFLKEMNYEQKIIKKFIHLFKAIRYKSFIGISTGFFSILCALKEHPDSEIIISGIGMSGGGHYYNVNSDKYSKRSLVDRQLILNLKKKYKTKLYTTDQNLESNSGIKGWQ